MKVSPQISIVMHFCQLLVCDPYHRCGTCWPGNCYAIQNYTRFYVKEYGPLSGREAMMAEIHNRGPIVCTIGGTGNFDFNYYGGIYEELADEQV